MNENPAAPRPIGTGLDEDGNELLTFVPGTSPHPYPWSDEAIGMIGSMLARLHQTTASFVPPRDHHWKSWVGRTLGEPGTAIGHGDLGPWNIMAIDGKPTGFIDWDTAGPIDPVWELAQVGWLNAQLHDDDIAERLGLGDAAARASQLRFLLDGYGLGLAERRGFVDKMVEFAVHDARNDAVQAAVTPETTTGVGEDGYPFAWGMAWRIRGASWILRNRRILERAITV